MKFSSKAVAALFCVSFHVASAGEAMMMSFGGKKGSSSSSVDECPPEEEDPHALVCAAPITEPASCEDMDGGRPGPSLGGVISDCQTDIRDAGYYYFTGDIQCQPGDDNSAISIGARGGRQINGGVVVDCKGENRSYREGNFQQWQF